MAKRENSGKPIKDRPIKDRPTKDSGKFDPKKKVKLKKYVLKKFKIYVSVGGYEVGQVIRLRTHRGTGIPMARYWRRRLEDAETDGCIKAVPDVVPGPALDPVI